MVRIGVIGLGFMGRMHLGAYQQIPNATVTAISDRSEQRAAGDLSGGWGNLEGGIEKVDMAGVTGTTDWRELIALDSVDAVDICVPTPQHEEVVLAALRAGKHVLCEKPLALDAASAQNLVDVAAKMNRILMPAMVVRFSPSYVWLRQAIRKITRIALCVLLVFIAWCRAPASGWFLDDAPIRRQALLDPHVHDADMVTDLFGMPNHVERHRQGRAQRVALIMDRALPLRRRRADGPCRRRLASRSARMRLQPSWRSAAAFTLSLHAQRSALDAECSAHRASLRRIHKELEHLQCRLVGTDPHVFQIDATNEDEDDVLFWANE